MATVLVVTALAAGGCGRGGGGEDGLGDVPEHTDKTERMRYMARVSGDLDFAVDGDRDVRVVRLRASGPQQFAISLLSVGPALGVEAPNGAQFRVAFDLTGFKGNGTYSLRAGSPRDLVATAEEAKQKGSQNVSAPDQSNLLVQYWPSGDSKAPPEVFDTVLVPCSIKVSRDGFKGKLTCEKVTDQAKSRTIAVEMEWDEPKDA